MTDALAYLAQVTERAKELYAMSDQGSWELLHPEFQRLWINMADEELRPGMMTKAKQDEGRQDGRH